MVMVMLPNWEESQKGANIEDQGFGWINPTLAEKGAVTSGLRRCMDY